MRNIPKDSKIAVAMSGGVDSGVAAALLVEEGYDVVGFFMHLWHEDADKRRSGNGLTRIIPENRCCSVESMEAARKTAGRLGIPFYTVDYREDFKEIVVDYFLSEYRAGRTPNPCVVCNKFIKFGKLLEYAKGLECDYLATGHYARIRIPADSETDLRGYRRREVSNSKNQITKAKEKPAGFARQSSGVEELAGEYKLLMAEDKSKDQSYFLWQLDQKQLEHILFPIGEMEKSSIVKIARKLDLPVAERPESFEICFVPDSLEDFLRRHIPEAIEPGPVLNTKGDVIGKHEGLPLYTYGQRRGFELEKYQGIPLYVVGVDKEKNALIVGRGKASEVERFTIEDTNWINQLDSLAVRQSGSKREIQPRKTSAGETLRVGEKKPEGLGNAEVGELADPGDFRCKVRIRHQGELMPGKVEILKGEKAKVILDEPARAVAPGQSAVFYTGEEVLGGGVILSFGG